MEKNITSIVNGLNLTDVEQIVKMTSERCIGAPRTVYERTIHECRGQREATSIELAQDTTEREDGKSAAEFKCKSDAHKRKVADAKKLTMDDHITALRAIVTDNSPITFICYRTGLCGIL